MDQANKYPWEIKPVPEEEMQEVNKHITGVRSSHIRIGPKGFYFPSGLMKLSSEIYNFELRPMDIIVASFPKSGTTWTQELVWLIENDHDYKTAAKKKLAERYGFLEFAMLYNNSNVKEWMMDNVQKNQEEILDMWKMLSTPATDRLAKASSPRFIKTHLPLSLLPPTLLETAKVVYVARDPRDVAVSYYHHAKLFNMVGFDGDFKTYWKHFITDRVHSAPYFPHILEAWEKREHPNVLFLFYEELSKDLPAAVRRVAQLLEKQITEEQVRKLCDHLHIDNFRKNKSVNNERLREHGFLKDNETFIRKGKVGGWGQYFDEEMTAQAEQWIEGNLRGTDLSFPEKLQSQ